ncbi:4'-phosphopantetheinyl transferase family protein [Desulfoplanes formicivorans]|uniref:4'-phosphopantetheinyl transferase domain-containing protein n=1 Tax=Desulfoplanes formicivorans TaxID=1592317 RepID=A0A194AHD5_9BACT|nr:4'-phosphopantetheinyl transferase superfamily protein [Desulfoplanes formicivorans]GAU08625.1 hypothetical protein DPF_1339 [Desulfoplanes formicivorans]
MKTTSLLLAAPVEHMDRVDETTFLSLIPDADSRFIRRNRRRSDRLQRMLARLLVAYGMQYLEGWNMDRGLAALGHESKGRPILAGSGRPISLSHSGRWAVCAIGSADQSCIGVDVEKVRPLQVEEFAIAFTPTELQVIRQQPDPASDLIRRWTIKEAILKALGTGLLTNPLDMETLTCPLTAKNLSWFWRHYPLEKGYWLTVGTPPPPSVMPLLLPTAEDLVSGIKKPPGHTA